MGISGQDYVELHAHSGYSFLDGASHPEELVTRAVELGMPALALTDHDGLYGSMEFGRAAKEMGLYPITGAEVTVRVDGWEAPSPGGHEPRNPVSHFHMTLLAENAQGYANLCRILTEAHTGSPDAAYPSMDESGFRYAGRWNVQKGRRQNRSAGHDCEHAGNEEEQPEHHPDFEWPDLELRSNPSADLSSILEHAEGIIALTGCQRSPLLHALSDSTATGEAFAHLLSDAFGERNLFVELQQNNLRGDTNRSRILGRLADRLNLPVVATGNVHYHRVERHRLQDVLVAIRHRTTLDGSHDVRRPNSCFHLAGAEEMAHRFENRPDALANTLRIAERCQAFDITQDLGYAFPDFSGSDEAPAPEMLAQVTLAALEERYPPGHRHRDEAIRRLQEELRLVSHHGLSGFFLVYRDILELSREIADQVRGNLGRPRSSLPPGRGRGSSVSSIICYLIGLSHVDPVENELFLGRFLNEALQTVPDIDLDFPREIREALILAVYDKYGREHAALVCTFPTYRLKSAVREIGKALALPQGDIEKLTKLAEHRSAKGVREELQRLPDFRDRAHAPLWTALGDLAEDAAGLPRHISQHVGGMIISSRPLVEIVPLQPAAMAGRVTCQWEKDSCEDAGFIKIDFLALGMLSLVEDAIELIHNREGTAPDLSRIDYKDAAVFDRICAGDTIGLFQIESRAQIQMVRRVQPRNLKDLAVQVAIVRPGPIVGGAVNPYVTRREALRNIPGYVVPYDHPLLEQALGETLGVIIFQDQVLKVCQDLAGFSDGQAEGLRRAMSRRRSREIMQSYWDAFRSGAEERGVDEETAKKVFTQVVAFSEFGFPKSHAVAFGLLAYQSAWLRHYYPVEFYVALFNNQPMGFYSLDALGRDARRNGIKILLPNVNHSEIQCTAEGQCLRIGLGFVRGWGSDIAEQVLVERERHGTFQSLPDFLRRTPATLRRPSIENLIWVGGFDEFGIARRELLWQTGLYLGPEEKAAARSTARRDDAQLEMGMDDVYGRVPFERLGDMDRMVAEYRMLRFSTHLHPLAAVRDVLPKNITTSDKLVDLPEGSTVTLAGIVVARQRPGTAKGFVFVLMEDEAGLINIIVKPKVYEKCKAVVRMEPFITARGRLQRDGLTINVIAYEIDGLRSAQNTPDLPDTMEYWGEPDDPGMVARGGLPSDVEAVQEGFKRAGRGDMARTIEGISEHLSEDAARLSPMSRPTADPYANPWKGEKSPFRYLTALRKMSPNAKSWG